MAARRKRAYRRRRRGFRRYKNFYNYHAVRIEYDCGIRFPSVTEEKPYFHTLYNMNVFSIDWFSILDHYPFWQNYARIFSYYKVRGMRIEVTPCVKNTSSTYLTYDGQVYVSYSAGLTDFDGVTEKQKHPDTTIVLNPVGKSFKYISVQGDQGRWYPLVTQDAMDGDGVETYFPAGAVQIYADKKGLTTSAPEWNVRIYAYVLFKQNKT